MGYRVGIQCLITQTEADDLVLSATPPVITADGQIIRPIRQQDGWYLSGHKVVLSHPPCDQVQQMKEGAQLGGGFLLLLAVIFLFRLIINFLKTMNLPEGSTDG